MIHKSFTVFAITGAVLSLFFLSGCEETSSPETEQGEYRSWEQDSSYLWYYGEAIEVPDTVIVDQAFEVVILTALSGCDLPGPTKLFERSENVFEVVPQDSFFTGVGHCPALVSPTEHRVSMQFGTEGESRVLITTMAGPFPTPDDSLATIEYSVFVKSE